MQKPEIPTNESDRLVALDRYKILDTLPEQVYDDLTQLAADICGTPIALISLIDKDRQWFKSRVGIDATETPRDISFCGHAVAANAILNVPDASLDPRFADNPLVTKDPSIRFYAGVPLITDDNFALGTLCVIDRQPHDLTEQEIRQLEALSRLVISQLELRLKEESLRILASVVESSVDAIITKTVEGIITSWNPAAERLFGYSEAEAIGQHISMLFPPERLDEQPQILARIMGGERVEHFETVRISKEGKRIEVSATISPLMNDAGEMVGISKIVRDISDRKRAEKVIKQQLASIEAAIDGIAILQDNNYIYLNKSHLEIFGYQHPEELLGRSWTELYSSEELIRFEQEVFPVLMQNQSWQGEAIATRKDGSTFNEELSLTINEGGFLICVCRDISDRKQAEQENFRITERFQFLLASSPVIIYSCKPYGDYGATFMSENVKAILGYKTEEFVTQEDFWASHIHPEDAPQIFAELPALFEKGNHTHEYRFLHRDGHYLWRVRPQYNTIIRQQQETRTD